MASVNRITLIGRLGRDPESINTKSGSSLTKFSLAVDEKWSGRDGQDNERTEWFDVTAFGKVGEACQRFLAKGSLCYVEGKMQSREYEKDGVKRKVWEVQAFAVQFLSQRKPAESNASRDDSQFPDDDLPF